MNVKQTMEDLIKEIRLNIPFDMPVTGCCEGRCETCPEKLVEFMDIEVSHWESRLKAGTLPNQEETENLSKYYNKVYAILDEQGLIKKHQVV